MSSEYTVRVFEFNSGPNTIHTIIHGLNTLSPMSVVFDQASQSQIIPASVIAIDPNTVQITTSIIATIYGRII